MGDKSPELLPETLDLLTAAGRQQLAVERQEFDRIIRAIHKVLNTA